MQILKINRFSWHSVRALCMIQKTLSSLWKRKGGRGGHWFLGVLQNLLGLDLTQD